MIVWAVKKSNTETAEMKEIVGSLEGGDTAVPLIDAVTLVTVLKNTRAAGKTCRPCRFPEENYNGNDVDLPGGDFAAVPAFSGEIFP